MNLFQTTEPFLGRHKTEIIRIVVACIVLYGLYSGVVSAVNDVTRTDPAQYITDQTCGYMDTADRNNTFIHCEDPLRCFQIQEHEKHGVSEPRCVSPGFVEGRCGYFEGSIVLTSMPAEFGGCAVLDKPDEILSKLPEGISVAWDKLQQSR